MASGRSGPTASPGPRTSVEPDRRVDGVLGPAPPAAQRHHHESDHPRVHARDDPGAIGRDGQPHGRLRQVPVGALDEVRRAAERRDHARETLGRGARGEGPLDRAGGRRVVPGQAAEDEQLAARARAVTAWSRASRRRPVRKSIASRTSSALPTSWPSTWFMSVSHATVRSPASAATVDQALGERLAASRDPAKAPEPTLTSMTRASSPAASFFERIEAVMSGIESTVAVTSRIA